MKNVRLFACVVAALFITGCSRDPKPGTPQAAVMGERYMRSMSDTLARAREFTFTTNERLDVITPGRKRRSLYFTRLVTVRRPNALYFDLHAIANSVPDVAVYYDGRTVTASEKPDGTWAQTSVPNTLDEMLDDVARRFGLPVPVGDVVYSSPYDAFIGKSAKGGFVGRKKIDGVSCVKLDYADDFVDVQLWLPASGPALPQRLEIAYKQAAVPLLSEIDFTSWKLNVPVNDATFAFRPPASQVQIGFADFVEGMASGTIPSGPPADSSMGSEARSSAEAAAR